MIDVNWINESKDEMAIKIQKDLKEILDKETITVDYGGNEKSEYSLHLYLQGSYKKGIALKNSDIDILVSVAQLPLPDSREFKYFAENRKWQEKNNVGFSDGNFNIWQNSNKKDEILKNLGDRTIYGKHGVKSVIINLKGQINLILKNAGYSTIIGSKSIKVKRKNESFDVVPSIIYFNVNKDNNFDSLRAIGVSIVNDKQGKKELIENYPNIDWFNSDKKNKETSYKYKKVVKFLKVYKSNNVNYKNLSGFMIEQIVYNVPNKIFLKTEKIFPTINNVVNYLINTSLTLQKFVCTHEVREICNRDFQKINENKKQINMMLKTLLNEIKSDGRF